MATKARFVRRATREAVTGPLVAAAVGLLYFLSLCFVDQGLAAFARVCPDKAQRLTRPVAAHTPGGLSSSLASWG